MMMEVIVFALVLVLAQLAVSVGMLCLVFSNWFTKKMIRKSTEMTKTIVEVMEKEDLL